MSASDISEDIIEDLYAEALLLADDARAAFDMRVDGNIDSCGDRLRIALSIEGLRTTTRVMHVLAWLLNQRAYLSGELSHAQLRRHNSLPEERLSDPANLGLLEPETQALIRESEELHARVARLDHDLRAQGTRDGTPVLSMHGRIAAAFASHG
ncbi:DUF1465 family protein [Qipengyuania zhejiangensis]|uniref:DUF1465 family protein n=1 Tax=Qipengyuania zhejiangensis TaxID=3077782 RepID=UPI002D7884A6|nr:DUF1465 family protein [Qipengyuania sp. Z2]